jgi:hypothetical protein
MYYKCSGTVTSVGVLRLQLVSQLVLCNASNVMQRLATEALKRCCWSANVFNNRWFHLELHSAGNDHESESLYNNHAISESWYDHQFQALITVIDYKSITHSM